MDGSIRAKIHEIYSENQSGDVHLMLFICFNCKQTKHSSHKVEDSRKYFEKKMWPDSCLPKSVTHFRG